MRHSTCIWLKYYELLYVWKTCRNRVDPDHRLTAIMCSRSECVFIGNVASMNGSECPNLSTNVILKDTCWYWYFTLLTGTSEFPVIFHTTYCLDVLHNILDGDEYQSDDRCGLEFLSFYVANFSNMLARVVQEEKVRYRYRVPYSSTWFASTCMVVL